MSSIPMLLLRIPRQRRCTIYRPDPEQIYLPSDPPVIRPS